MEYTYEVNHTATRSLTPLSYSDGLQYSLSQLAAATAAARPDDAGRRLRSRRRRSAPGPTRPATQPAVRRDRSHPPSRDLYDIDRDGVVDHRPTGVQCRAELDLLGPRRRDGYVSDDERDEDADGLTNYDETTAR